MKVNSNKIIVLMRSLIFTELCLVIMISLLSAEDSLIRVNAHVDKSIISIGDRLTYTLTIEHAKDIHIEQPGPGANLGQFEIKDYEIHKPLDRNGLVTQQFDYKISVFDTGRYVIPPFPVAFAESDTSRNYQIIQSDPIEIYVKSVLTAEDNEIHDIKPPQTIPYNYRRIIIAAGIGVLALALIFLGLYYWKLRRRGVTLFRRETIRPAHEIALEELQGLRNIWKEMLQKGEHKILFTRLADILRKYLENRFFVKALEETTAEISESLKELELGAEEQERAVAVLDFSDGVKFAKYIPTGEETENQITLLENFIATTKLVFAPVEHEVAIEKEESVAEGELPATITDNITELNKGENPAIN
jgi:hypothetical protein